MDAFQGPLSLCRTLIWKYLSLLNLWLYIVTFLKAGGSPNAFKYLPAASIVVGEIIIKERFTTMPSNLCGTMREGNCPTERARLETWILFSQNALRTHPAPPL